MWQRNDVGPTVLDASDDYEGLLDDALNTTCDSDCGTIGNCRAADNAAISCSDDGLLAESGQTSTWWTVSTRPRDCRAMRRIMVPGHCEVAKDWLPL